MGGKRGEMTQHSKPPSRGAATWKTRNAFRVTLAVISLAVFTKPSSSLMLLQSFPNSSLWRERHLNRQWPQQQQQQQEQLPDYYNILGVHRNASKDDIKTAFRQLVKQYHPDANPNTDTTSQFQTINKAYQILSDPQNRKTYNSQTYHYGLSSDTPNFIIDALESDYEAPEVKNTASTDAVRYQPLQWQPNENGRGSLLKNDHDEEQHNGQHSMFRIRSY